jgi:tetrahydromethanopterin S-methyltransferase subunit H
MPPPLAADCGELHKSALNFNEEDKMFQLGTEQKVCEVGGVKFGGQPGEYPCVCVNSIFQKHAEALLKTQERISQETGVPGMADVVANTGKEFKLFIDFVTSVSDMPFCIDAWVMKPKLEGAAYCAEKGLLDRMFYNSLTVWETDLETEIREISQMGVKHVLLVAFDQEDQMPSGRITGTQRLLDAIEKVGAEFESIFVDTSVMNGPATAFCGIANRMIKEKWGFPTASAPSNGSYMDLKRFKELWDFKGWSATDAALEALSAFYYHDMIFSGPMAGATRIMPAVAQAEAFLASAVFAETKRMPKDPNHPLYKLFPDFVEQLKSIAG